MAEAAGCKGFVLDGDVATLLAVDNGLGTEGRGNLCPGCGKEPTDDSEGTLIKRPAVGLAG